jgi:putative addiction module component (TIGR02574 family)
MSNERLTREVLALPLAERIDLAEALWQSINDARGPGTAEEEREAAEAALRRDAELSSGAVAGRSHQEVMEAARRSLGCE